MATHSQPGEGGFFPDASPTPINYRCQFVSVSVGCELIGLGVQGIMVRGRQALIVQLDGTGCSVESSSVLSDPAGWTESNSPYEQSGGSMLLESSRGDEVCSLELAGSTDLFLGRIPLVVSQGGVYSRSPKL